MGKYRKRPVEIEAREFATANDGPALAAWSGGYFLGSAATGAEPQVRIPTLEGEMTASLGDWLICGVQGEFYPCKPDIFSATYESADVADRRDNTDSEVE